MDDLEFIQRCVNQDKHAWAEFTDKYSNLIYKYLLSTLISYGLEPIAARQNAEDLFQQVFLSLVNNDFHRLKSFQGRNGCSLASWLRIISVTCAIDFLRRLKSQTSLEEKDEDELSLREVLTDSSRNSRDGFNLQEKLSHLKDCIEELDSDEQYFLELHLNQGLTLEQIKGHLRISRGATDMRKARIISRLKECFKNKGFELDS